MTISNNEGYLIHSISSVKATKEQDVYILEIDITDSNNERYVCDYVSRPDDLFGANPLIREWLSENLNSVQIVPYTPPTIEQIRAAMPSISKRQLRLALVRSGISLDQVEAAIESLPAGSEKDEIRIEWDSANTYERLNPGLIAIADALDLSAEIVDEMWNLAVAI